MRRETCRIVRREGTARQARYAFVSLLLAASLGAQGEPGQGFDYFGQRSPGNEIQLFAPLLVSVEGSTEKSLKAYAIWRVRKVEGGWSSPEKVIDIEEADIMEFHPTVTRKGDVYFCHWDYAKQKGSIYKAVANGDSFLPPVKVDIPEDSTTSDVDPFVDPDERYIIFGSRRRGGLGGVDVFISYRGADTWTPAIHLGERFNTTEHDNSIDISPDGRYAFIYKQGDAYWMEADYLFEEIERLRE
jgi:hypothetical protein